MQLTNEKSIEYTLFSNQTGIISGDHALLLSDKDKLKISFSFLGASTSCDSGHVVIESRGRTYYRTPVNNCIEIEAALLYGDVKLAFCIDQKVWSCEHIFSMHREGCCVILPSDVELYAKLSSLRLELEKLNAKLAAHDESIASFHDRLDEVLAGYDLI